MQAADEDLSTLDAIRAVFLERFSAAEIGYHALGERVLQRYFDSETGQSRPASAMTFRNFLQGRTTLRDPTGLLLYFEALGASPEEMRRIRVAMQQEVDRRLAAPSQDNALRAFRDTELADMPYSRALAECEAATRFEQSLSAPIASVSPTQYLLGTPDGPGGPDDPRNWGMLQHCRALQDFLEQVELRLQDDFAAVPAKNAKKRKWLAAAGVREMGTAYVSYLLAFPELAERLLSQRRYLLQGPMPERERLAAVASVQSLVRSMYHPYERFAETAILEGDRQQLRRTPDGEIALEAVGNRLFGIGLTFYVTVVLGSVGTGAFFIASQHARREFAGEPLTGPPVWSGDHEALIRENEAALVEANAMLEDNARVRYGELRGVFDRMGRRMRAHHRVVWEQDFASTFVREVGTEMATGLHHRGLLSNSALVAFLKRFLTTSEGRRLQQAQYPERQFSLPEREVS